MLKNRSNIKVLNTLIMCSLSFVMFFSSIHKLFDHLSLDNIEIVDELDNNKSEKEIDEKNEFTDESIKSNLMNHFISSQLRKYKFQKIDDEIRNGTKKIIIPPPRYS